MSSYCALEECPLPSVLTVEDLKANWDMIEYRAYNGESIVIVRNVGDQHRLELVPYDAQWGA